MNADPPVLCPRGHRIVFTTGACYSLVELEPGLFEYVIGPCEAVKRAEERSGGEVELGRSGSDEGSGKRISLPPDGSSTLTNQATETKGLTACGAPKPSKIENLADSRPHSTLLNVDERSNEGKIVQR